MVLSGEVKWVTWFYMEVRICRTTKAESKLEIANPSAMLRLKVARQIPLAHTLVTSFKLLRIKASSDRLKYDV